MFRSLVVVVKFVKVLNFSPKRRLKFVCACGTTMGQTERGLAIRQVKFHSFTPKPYEYVKKLELAKKNEVVP